MGELREEGESKCIGLDIWMFSFEVGEANA